MDTSAVIDMTSEDSSEFKENVKEEEKPPRARRRRLLNNLPPPIDNVLPKFEFTDYAPDELDCKEEPIKKKNLPRGAVRHVKRGPKNSMPSFEYARLSISDKNRPRKALKMLPRSQGSSSLAANRSVIAEAKIKVSPEKEQREETADDYQGLGLFDSNCQLDDIDDTTLSLYELARTYITTKLCDQITPAPLSPFTSTPTEEDTPSAEEILEQLRKGDISEVHRMPRIKKPVSVSDRIPSLRSKNNSRADAGALGLSAEEKRITLLKLHKANWKAVRSNWVRQRIAYINERCSLHLKILEELYVEKITEEPIAIDNNGNDKDKADEMAEVEANGEE